MADRNIEAIHPLTPLQEGILSATLDGTHPGAYFNQYTCLVEGTIDPGVLQLAWSAVVERHSVLRTLFTWEKRERPLQLVRRRVELPWQVLDWRDCPAADLAERLAAFLQRDRELGFSLDVAPLMRLALVRLEPGLARLVWSFHHIVLDGWSMRLVLEEVRTIYAALCHGNAHDLEPAADFFAFVDWQSRRDSALDAEFWQQRLAGFTVPTTPGISAGVRPGPAAARPGEIAELTLSGDVSDQLRALAKRHRVTLNTVCATAWAALLARYCDTSDVVFGTTVAGRSAEVEGIERTAGIFINTLPVRIRLGADDLLGDLLHEMQTQQVAQQAFEQTPLTAIHRYSDLPARSPMFETILVFENLREVTGSVQGLLTLSDEKFIEYSNFPLAILIVPGNEVQLIVVHDTRRFSTDAIDRLLQHFRQVLLQFTMQDPLKISAISLLTDTERHRLVEQWNDTARPRDASASVVGLFEQCVARNPGAIAVTAGESSISYGDLNSRANQLAHCLLRSEAAGGKPVVIYTERGVTAIVGMLAALKAGATYVPMDVHDTGERLQQVLNDLGRAYASAGEDYKPPVLTEQHLADRVPPACAQPVLLDDLPDDVPDTNPDLAIAGDALAYIIYTSGSTGRPKGVMISHRALWNSTLARLEYYDNPVTSFALLSSLATDSSIAGIYWTLCTGGNLVIPGHRAELDIGQLAVLIERNRITHTLCVPSLYALILEHAEAPLLQPLQVVVIAGEAGSNSLVRRHFETLPETALYNEYGPSEACVWASAARLEAADARTGVTIGRPIANTHIYILDKDRRPVPVGVAGELAIGGSNVASGYLGDEGRTRAAFVPDIVTGRDQHLYMTGDRARYRSDGCIEYLGRVDNQLKVRGFRVEPGEIESVLAEHPDVESAAVLIDHSSALDNELAALIDLAGEAAARALLTDIEALDDGAVERALAESTIA